MLSSVLTHSKCSLSGSCSSCCYYFLFIRGQLWEVLEQDMLGDSIGNELEEEKLEGSRLVKKLFASTQGK